MLWLRRFIFTFPVLVLAFFVAAFSLVKSEVAPHLNILTMGSIGEPENVNPIRATTTSASDVTELVFNGLIKTDEDLNLIGDLASGWDLSQDSRLFFNSEADAAAVLQAAVASIPPAPATGPDDGAAAGRTPPATQPANRWRLVGARRDGTALHLQFAGDAGTSYQDLLADALKQHRPRPVWIVSISPRPDKTFADGARMNPQAIEERARRALVEAKADAVIVQTYVLLDSAVELVGHGDPAAAGIALDGLFRPEDTTAGLADVNFENFSALDKPIFTFHLRKGVMWQEGELDGKRYEPVEFTADDVEFTYRMLVSAEVASPRAADYLTVESAKVLDRYTVQVTYKKPYSSAVLSWAMSILPRHILADRSVKWWADHFDRRPIGTGPFKFARWNPGETIRLVRNEQYYEGPPNLDAIWIRYIADPLNIQLALGTGGIDFYSVEPFAVERFKRENRFELFEFEARGYNYIGWNLKNPLFQDRRVRLALAHAIDVEEIIKYKMYGHAVRSRGIYTPQFWFNNPDIRPFSYDPAKARQLLAEAGWKDKDKDGFLVRDGQRFEFDLITNHANEIRRDIGVIAQANLMALGIKVNLKLFEWSVFIQRYIDQQAFDACILGWSTGIDYDMYQLFHSSQAHPKELNFCSYKNPVADRLIEQLRTTFDRERIRQLAWTLQQTIYEDQPYLWLYVPQATVALQKGKFRVYRPVGGGQWREEPIRQVKAGFALYLPYWYRTADPPEALRGRERGP